MNKQNLAGVYAFWTGYYPGMDCFEWASNKAYLDMNRTMTFAQSHRPEKEIAREREAWRNGGTDLIRRQVEAGCTDFESWHAAVCGELICLYRGKLIRKATGDACSLTYGQAQKWLNMTLKYLWLLDRLDLLSGSVHDFVQAHQRQFHVPLDSYILRYAARENRTKSDPFGSRDNGLNRSLPYQTAWSRISDAAWYTAYQKQLWENLAEGYTCPLEWELEHWQKALDYYG